MPPYPFPTPHPSRSSATQSRSYRDRHLSRPSIWQDLDRSQVLGDDGEGHTGCVNALSWASDGGSLLSGSDDRRICIWKPSETTPPTPTTPHPLSLSTTISTGHRANIFSAKYLPHTGGGSEGDSAKIVTCAGDGLVKVFDVGRLGRVDGWGGGRRRRHGRGGLDGNGGSVELDGESGDGVRVIRCHTDRVKRISTEDNPSTFLTVSEDGTVRQHDLRTTHSCPNACPTPLFTTNPLGTPVPTSRYTGSSSTLSLYTLSVSVPNPYLFTVAGTAPYAYLLDRRMTGRVMEDEWGRGISTRSGGRKGEEEKVKCVRRFGLEPEEEVGEGLSGKEDQGGTRRRQVEGRVRHITAVEMSKDVAEDLIVSFSGHSVALFSIHDQPDRSNAKASSSKTMLSPSSPSRRGRTRSPPDGSAPGRKRRRSGSDKSEVVGPVLPPAASDEAGGSTPTTAKGKGRAQDVPYAKEMSPSGPEPLFGGMVDDVLANEAGDENESDDNEGKDMAGEKEDETGPSGTASEESEEDLPELPPGPALGTASQDDTASIDDEGGTDEELDDDEDIDMDDSDGNEDDDEVDEDDFDEDEEDDDNDDDEGLDEWEENEGLYVDHDGPRQLFSDVEVVYQRRNYKGARNVQTVKDVTFLGARSDKVCSGSDDGNFFVWDKRTGMLDGIWEGDGSVVNVIEQHPSLPIVAVSGIDDTVKIFAPLSQIAKPSMKRVDRAEQIVKANTMRVADRPRPVFGRVAMIEQYARLLAQSGGPMLRSGEGEDEGAVPDCVSQ